MSHSLLILKIRTGSQVRSSPGFYGGTGKVRFMITGRCLCGRSDGKHRPGTAYGHGVFFMRPVGWEAPARYGLRSRRAFYAASQMGGTGEVRLMITARCLCGRSDGKHRRGSAYDHGGLFMRPVGWAAPARFGLRSRPAVYAARKRGAWGFTFWEPFLDPISLSITQEFASD